MGLRLWTGCANGDDRVIKNASLAVAVAALTALAVVTLTYDATSDVQLIVSTDVRINARQLEDGRLEFALEHEGERIFPRVRYFPANVGHDRWLRSSPITLELTDDNDVAAPSANERANAQPETWEWSSRSGQLTSVQLSAGWWHASIMATYSGRGSHFCLASLTAPARAFKVSVLVSGPLAAPVRQGNEHEQQVFKIGPDGDAPAGQWRASTDICNHASFRIRTATDEEIQAELTRRREAAEHEAASEDHEERRQVREAWVSAWSPSGDLCDPTNPQGVLARAAVGVFDQPGEEATRWAAEWAAESVVFCADGDDPFTDVYAPVLPAGVYRLYLTGANSNLLGATCDARFDEARDRAERANTGSIRLYALEVPRPHWPADRWRLMWIEVRLATGWDRDLLPGTMYLWPNCGERSVVFIERLGAGQ